MKQPSIVMHKYKTITLLTTLFVKDPRQDRSGKDVHIQRTFYDSAGPPFPGEDETENGITLTGHRSKPILMDSNFSFTFKVKEVHGTDKHPTLVIEEIEISKDGTPHPDKNSIFEILCLIGNWRLVPVPKTVEEPDSGLVPTAHA